MCQHEKIEANPICNCDSNIAFIYYWWNAGTASSTAFRLVITNHSGYIGLRRCIDNRTSAEIFRQEVRCLGVSMLPFFNQKIKPKSDYPLKTLYPRAFQTGQNHLIYYDFTTVE